jgi:hypothetical protein
MARLPTICVRFTSDQRREAGVNAFDVFILVNKYALNMLFQLTSMPEMYFHVSTEVFGNPMSSGYQLPVSPRHRQKPDN